MLGLDDERVVRCSGALSYVCRNDGSLRWLFAAHVVNATGLDTLVL